MRALILALLVAVAGDIATAAAEPDIPLPLRDPRAVKAPPAPATWSEEEIALAQDQCAKLIVPIDLVFEPLPPIRKEACGDPVPVLLKAIGAGPPIRIHPPATVNCAMTERLNAWLRDSVQPVARVHLNSPISEILVVASYACRHRYNDPTKPLSEHAKANALDIAAFKTAAGEWVRISGSWGLTKRDLLARAQADAEAKAAAEAEAAEEAEKQTIGAEKAPADQPDTPTERGRADSQPSKTAIETPADQEHKGTPASATKQDNVPKEAEKPDSRTVFIRKIHEDACGFFGTVLGPEANDAHRNHFHLDLAPRKRSAYCE